MHVRESKLKSSGRAEVALLRSAPAKQGAALAPAATLEVGDIVAVELDDVQMPWVLVEVLVGRHEHTAGDHQCWMGLIKNGDQVLIARRLEPTHAGALMFVTTDKETHVFEEDVRLKVKLELVETRTSGRNVVVGSVKRQTLDQATKLVIDELCAMDVNTEQKRKS